MFIATKVLEDFAECFCGRLMDNRINYYLKVDGTKEFKANTVHAGILWSREAINNLNILYEKDVKNYSINDLLLLISYSDILLDATDQIYRVLFNTSKLEDYSSIAYFKNKPRYYNKLDDRLYFKELRAIFSAHPVNINDPKGKGKRFADIPTKKNPLFCFKNYPPIEGDYDFFERVWTNTKKDEDTIYMPIKVSEIFDFDKFLSERFDIFLKRLRILAYHRDKI